MYMYQQTAKERNTLRRDTYNTIYSKLFFKMDIIITEMQKHYYVLKFLWHEV